MQFAPLSLGNVHVGMPAVQAALSGYSDLPMRVVAREHGAPYALHEVVLDTNVLQKGKLQRRILTVPEHDHPVGGQLMGSVPETFGAAARELVGAGFDVVDINFGCPVNKVLGRHRGGWLLQDPTTALAMVDAVLQAVAGDAPVTVKMRRGSDDSPDAERRFFTILEGAIERGVAAVTVHPRTVAQKYVGPSRWEFLARCKRHVGAFTLLGSGDLFSAFDVVAMLQQTGVDGVTIARGCIGNPFVFTQVRDLLAGRPALRPTAAMQRAAILRHWELAVPYYGNERNALPHVRMHAIKYGQYHREPIWARERLVSMRGPQDLLPLIDEVFADRHDEGVARELTAEDAVAPSLASCNEGE
ncbi:MAG: tRNA-dihydrouridine synthase [Planctomycetes bacterium]|nr:tRNA-dihydrouridine synthase [Planctomycetota bacterium]MCB9886596.1 tRNA-dihydrouridine synthase [Planctomycetota bacterium]